MFSLTPRRCGEYAVLREITIVTISGHATHRAAARYA